MKKANTLSTYKKPVIASELATFMEKNEIKVSCTHLHVVFFDDNGVKLQYPQDKWYILVEYKDRFYGTFYTQGVGNRVPQGFGMNRIKHENGRWVSADGKRFTDAEAIKAGWLALPKEGPRTDFILQALLNDADGTDESFKKWATGRGGNPDSITQLHLYLRCQETRDALIRMFGSAMIKTLNEKVQDL